MASTVATRYMPVGLREPNISSGWTIRVLDYKDMKSLVAVISEYTNFSFTQELNAPGEGSITLDEDSPFWTGTLGNGESCRTLKNHEYVFEAWDNNTPRFAWLAQVVTETIADESGTRAVTISGPGIAHTLAWAIINRPGWPTEPPIVEYFRSDADPTIQIPIRRAESPQDSLPAYTWRFPMQYPTMRMWLTAFKAAQRRGVIPWVKPLFTATKDSAKRDWKVIRTIEEVVTKSGYKPPELNQNLLDFLNDCTGQDYSKWFGQHLEWLMYPGHKLDVRTRIGVDRSKNIRFFSGDILSTERTRSREEIYNRVIAADVEGGESNRSSKSSIAAWNIREQRNTANKNVTDTALRNQLADRYIAQTRNQKDEWSIRIPADDPRQVPYRHFFVGDHIGVDVNYLSTAGPQKYRIVAITINVSAESVVPECELTLQSIIDSRLKKLEKEITNLLNNPKVVDISGLTDVEVPDASKNKKSTLVYNPETGKWEAVDASSTGSGSGARMFIQAVDPATQTNVTVQPGDFWLETYSD